jgi:acetyltransferase-like isoleucine patch superfamily enzyme
MKYQSLSHTLNILTRELYFLYGKVNYLRCFWWKINIGKNARFNGKCYFERYPGTKIFIGDNCTFLSRENSNKIGINRPCAISTQKSPFPAEIRIGNNCGFSGTVIAAFKGIIIGNNVKCGANTLITDSDWHSDDYRSGEPANVIIGDNVWLGEGVKILKGVTIGRNALIGAGSVVTKDIPSDVVAAGNPCIIIKTMNK